MPEQARAVAKDLGLPYYETSVLTYFGVNQVSLSCVAGLHQICKKILQPVPFCYLFMVMIKGLDTFFGFSWPFPFSM
jgi:hypothetical protein